MLRNLRLLLLPRVLFFWSDFVLLCCVVRSVTSAAELLTIPVTSLFPIPTEKPPFTTASQHAFSYAIWWHNRQNLTFRLEAKHSVVDLNDSAATLEKFCDNLETSRSVAFFSDNVGRAAHDLEVMTRLFQMPMFTSGTVLSPIVSEIHTEIDKPIREEQKFFFQLKPHVLDAVIDTIFHYQWVNFSFLCNSPEGLHHVEELMASLRNQRPNMEFLVDIRFIPDLQQSLQELKQLDRYLERQPLKKIIIDFDTQAKTQLLLDRLILMGMNRDNYAYLIANFDVTDLSLSEFRFSRVNITGFTILNRGRPEVATFLKNLRDHRKTWSKDYRNSPLNDSESTSALMFDAVNVFSKAMQIFLSKPGNRDLLVKYLNPSATPPTSCFTQIKDNRKQLLTVKQIADRQMRITLPLGKSFANILTQEEFSGLTGSIRFSSKGRRQNMSIAVVEVQEDTGPVVVGEWKQGHEFNLSQSHYAAYIPREPIGNRTYRVVTILSPPFLEYRKPKKGEVLSGNTRFEGFCVDLMESIKQHTGIKYEFHLVRDGKFGSVTGKDANGTDVWNGLIGELLNNTADIALAPLTISKIRARVVQFTDPFLTFGISVMIKKPGKTKPGIFSFLLPVSNVVWLAILAACLVVSVGLYTIARISPFEWTLDEDPKTDYAGVDAPLPKTERQFTFPNAFWFSFAAFVQQGVDIAPKSPGARILSSAWWFFTMIIIAYYTANLAAFLTVARMVTPIEDWKDLTRPELGMSYGTVDSGSTKDFFLTTGLTPFNEMGVFMKRNPSVYAKSINDGVERVRNSKATYAFLLESRMNEYYNNKEPCNTMMVGSPFGDNGYGIATPLGSHLIDDLNMAVLKLRENQDLARMYKEWWIEKGQCSGDDQQSTSDALALINVAGVFYILTGGLILALLTSLFEFYYNARKEYRKYQTNFTSFIHQKARLSIHGPNMDEPQRTTPVNSTNHANRTNQQPLPPSSDLMCPRSVAPASTSSTARFLSSTR